MKKNAGKVVPFPLWRSLMLGRGPRRDESAIVIILPVVRIERTEPLRRRRKMNLKGRSR